MFAVVALATGCQTYASHQAAMVPHATPLPSDGQPLGTQAELGFGATNLADAIPATAGKPNVGDAVPTVQLRSAIDIRLNSAISIGAVMEHGLVSGSQAVTSSQPPLHDGPTGYGAHIALSIPTSMPGLRIGLMAEMLVWSVPYVQYDNCIMNCEGVSTNVTTYEGADSVATFAFGLIPSYRSGKLTVFGGMTIRNQPTVEEKLETVLPGDAGVEGGPWNVTLHVGAEYDFGVARMGVLVHQTVTRDPIEYGPSLAAMLTIPFGDPRPTPPAPVQYPWGASPAM